MDNIPVIRIELERMQHTLRVALHDYATQLDADLQAAVKSYCTQGRLRDVIYTMVNATLDNVIRLEIQRFFTHGEGRAVIANAIKERLLKGDIDTSLDIILDDMEP